MKKTIKFFAAALAVLAAISCTKENPENSDFENGQIIIPTEITLNASFVNSATKTTLKDNVPNWESTDRICVYPYNPSNTNNNYFSPYDGAYFDIDSFSKDCAVFRGTPKGVFYTTYDIYGAIFPGESILRSNGSPQNANTVFNKYIFAYNTLANQTAVLGDFSNATFSNSSTTTSNLSCALTSTNNETLSFKNINAHLKFTVDISGVRTIELSAESVTKFDLSSMDTGSDLGGTIYYYPHTEPDIRMGLSGDNPIIFTNGSSDFTKGGLYYVAIPAVKMSGLTITLKDAAGNIIKAFNKSSEFSAYPNHIYNIGSLKEDTEIGEDVQINTFAEAVHKTDANGTIIGTDVTFTVQAPNASKVKDFRLTATLDNYRSYSTTNPNASGVMTVLNDNKYLPRGEKGYYFINCEYTVNGNKHTQSVRVNIPEPVFSSSTEFTNSYSYYCNGYIDAANQMDAGTLQINRSSATINYDIVSLHPITFEVEINGQTFRTENSKYSTTTWGKELTSVPAGKYSMKTRVTFDGITKESIQDVYMTGLPMKSFNASDWLWPGTAPTLYVNNKAELTGITVPEGKSININVNAAAELWGYNADTYIVYTINLGNNSYTETTQGHSYSNKQYTLNNGTGTITSSQHITMTTGCNYAKDNMRIILNKFEAYYR